MGLQLTQRWGVLAVCLLILVLASCGNRVDATMATPPTAVNPSPAPGRLLSPSEFAAAVADPARVTINVHVPFEGDIPGTDLFIPFDQIAQRVDVLPANRSTPLAVYCRTGPMSTTAVDTLSEIGYTDVVELRGGMRGWQESGRPLTGV